ncbi:MAG: aldehyde dehydrogenase family protein [Clostridiales Family XIII bacterium]|jgi:succinate-semialdehyde dehydrogenase|nr:aldehyde dehydrogenase family protein [Clostridiales Family XIII bacterium]
MEPTTADAKAYISEYIRKARIAQAEFEQYSQEDTDRAVRAIAKTIFDNAALLAEMAVEETNMGNVADKTAKNRSKAQIIWNSLKGKKSKGILDRDEATGITRIAKPMGVIAAITPVTNPIVTPMSNAMFALKGGNAIIVTPHHNSTRCSGAAVDLIKRALKDLDIPENIIQIIDRQSRENTRELIASADVVIATGGMGMVKAAYSSGKPALGVGTGNIQCIIDDDADISEAVPKIAAGRAFDYGIICSAEQSVICTDARFDAVLRAFEENGAYVVRSARERDLLRGAIFTDKAANRHSVGQSAQDIGKLAGIEVPARAKLIVVEAEGTGEADPLGREKMCPVLAAYRSRDFKDSVEIAKRNLEAEGKGHSVCIHSNNRENIEYAGLSLSVSRFVINQVCASSDGGSFHNGLNPTNTLGCGSWGNNSISENLTHTHLINISRIAEYMPNNPVPSEEELWSSL